MPTHSNPFEQHSLNKIPFFSIILPTYNRAWLLVRAVQSVLKQTFFDWELIIVDDGSEDDTEQILKQMVFDGRILFLKIEHGGHIKARSVGIEKARGKITTFLDSDDFYKPKHLQKNFDIFQLNQKIDVLHGTPTILGETEVFDMENPGEKISLYETANQGTFFIKNKILPHISFRNLPFPEDYFFLREVKRQGWNVQRIVMPTYVYDRNYSDQLTKNYQYCISQNERV